MRFEFLLGQKSEGGGEVGDATIEPYPMIYFQPDFYGVSNRIAWSPRRDEALDVWTAKLK